MQNGAMHTSIGVKGTSRPLRNVGIFQPLGSGVVDGLPPSYPLLKASTATALRYWTGGGALGPLVQVFIRDSQIRPNRISSLLRTVCTVLRTIRVRLVKVF